MPKISTHLHLALILSDVLKIRDLKSMMLGSAYPDVLDDKRLFLSLHYKENCLASCDLKAFLKDINQYDALIFDMQKVSPHSNLFKTRAQDERESLALKNIQALDKEPMPLYIPDPLKKESYEKILHKVILDFLERYKKMLTMR